MLKMNFFLEKNTLCIQGFDDGRTVERQQHQVEQQTAGNAYFDQSARVLTHDACFGNFPLMIEVLNAVGPEQSHNAEGQADEYGDERYEPPGAGHRHDCFLQFPAMVGTDPLFGVFRAHQSRGQEGARLEFFLAERSLNLILSFDIIFHNRPMF